MRRRNFLAALTGLPALAVVSPAPQAVSPSDPLSVDEDTTSVWLVSWGGDEVKHRTIKLSELPKMPPGVGL